MASRNLVDQRRQAMEDALRNACRQGQLTPGSPLPAMRDLAEQYGLSRQVAWKAIQNLTAEGLLTTTPRAGTFVTRPRQDVKLFLLTTPHVPIFGSYLNQIENGFEDRISELGGTSLTLVESEARSLQDAQKLPEIAGVFRSTPSAESSLEVPAVMPFVQFGPAKMVVGASDCIVFDDRAGGKIATQHLLAMGHTRVAYLALHTAAGEPSEYYWSVSREEGWKDAMVSAGLTALDLALYARNVPPTYGKDGKSGPMQHQLAVEITRQQILTRPEITAVVAANVTAAEGLFVALHESGLPANQWPAVICFDKSTSRARGVLSYMRLPWEEVGRQAANLLWARASGLYSGPARTQTISMQLIQRLSCRPANLNELTAELFVSNSGALVSV